jgi:threonine/homoserine/homoserine lactone efflux protein
LAALDDYTPRQSARLGALLAGANPKNLVMALAAGAEIAVLADGSAAVAAGAIVFVAVGSMGVATPIAANTILGDRASPALANGREWLDRNSDALAVAVLAVLGALVLVKVLPAVI